MFRTFVRQLIDEVGNQAISLMRAQGHPPFISVVTDLGGLEKSKHKDAKFYAKRLIGEEFGKEAECHIVAAMGFSDGSTDFRQIFREMGIEDRWILTPGATASEIRKAFQVFSQSTIQTNQTTTFTQAALGGFVH